jgi:transcriptional regulator with XRE-family HTH domain
MDKAQHGDALAAAMARQHKRRDEVAAATGRSVRTVTNWTTGQTMPSRTELETLRQLLGDYAAESIGDPVIAAVKASSLIDWRQGDVITTYQKHLHQQQREEAG